jgi:hypothetical protein
MKLILHALLLLGFNAFAFLSETIFSHIENQPNYGKIDT